MSEEKKFTTKKISDGEKLHNIVKDINVEIFAYILDLVRRGIYKLEDKEIGNLFFQERPDYYNRENLGAALNILEKIRSGQWPADKFLKFVKENLNMPSEMEAISERDKHLINH